MPGIYLGMRGAFDHKLDMSEPGNKVIGLQFIDTNTLGINIQEKRIELVVATLLARR